MHPLRLLVVGALLVFLDAEINGFDVLPDLVGVLLAAAALVRVRRTSRWLDLALAGTLAILPGTLPRVSGTVVADLGLLGHTALVFGTCSAVVAGARNRRLRRSADLVRRLDLGLAVAVVPFMLFGPAEPVTLDAGPWTPLVLAVALAVLALAVWWLLLMWRTTERDLPGPRAPAEAAR